METEWVYINGGQGMCVYVCVCVCVRQFATNCSSYHRKAFFLRSTLYCISWVGGKKAEPDAESSYTLI